MDARLAVLVASLGLLGFLFYPRPEPPPAAGEWVTTLRKVEGEPPRFPAVLRTEPVLATYDLDFIYRLDRFNLQFEKPAENGPKLYEVFVSPTREGPYQRVFTLRSASRFYPYTVQSLPEPVEARWIQVAVTDWFSGRPVVKSFQAGPLYRRDWNPIRTVRVSHNASEAAFLIDGVTTDGSKWAGAKTVEVTTEKEGKKSTEKQRRPPNGTVWALFDLGSRQRIYGTRVTTDGNGNCPKSYRLLFSNDGRAYELVHTSETLADETRALVHLLPEPLEARFVRLEIPTWYGDYPELRECEVFTDSYRLPPPKAERMSDYNPVAVAYDNGGVDVRRSPHLVTGFVFDRGEGAEDRYGWRTSELTGPATEAQRTFLYHYDALRFKFAGLDPSRLYWIQVTTLQNKDGGRLQNLLADGYLLHGDEVPVPTGDPKPAAYFIPPEAVADGVLDVALHRLRGPNAVVSELTLFEARRSAEPVAVAPTLLGEATRAPSPVAVDGRLDEWDRLYPLRSQGDITDAEAFVQWDEENLYVALRVPHRLFSGGSSFLDTLDLFLDTRHTQSPTTYRKGDVHLRVFRLGSGKELVRFVKHYSEEVPPRTDVPPVEWASRRERDRLVWEMRLPRSNLLEGWEPRVGRLIGFNYALSTRDGRRGWYASAGADDPPSRWRTLRLLGSIRGEVVVVPQEEKGGVRREPRERFYAGERLWLFVRDPDRNRNPRAVESVTLRLRGGTGGEREVSLREVDRSRLEREGLEKALATDSEDFAAVLETEFGTEERGPDAPYAVRGGEVLTFTYHDPFYEPSGAARDVEATVAVKAGTTGTFAVTDAEGKPLASFAAGTVLRFRVEDADLTEELEPSEREGQPPVRRFGLPVRVGRDADRATVEMVEQAPGVFVGELRTEYGETPNPSDAVLQGTGTQTVEAVYLDRLQETGRTHVPLVVSLRVEIGASGLVRLRPSGGEFLSEPDRLVFFRCGSGLVVRVEDADLNRDPTTAETASVVLVGDQTGDRVTVPLRESGTSSSLFEGFVRTQYATTPNPNNEMLEVVGNETVTATYLDAIQGSGATNVAVLAQARTLTGNDGTLALTRADYLKRMTRLNAGDTVYVRVTEGDDVERIVVEAVSERTGDRETFPLTPSAATANTFLGSFPTAFGTVASPNDGTLQVVGEDVVRVVYRDALRASGEPEVPVSEECRVNVGNDGTLRVFRDGGDVRERFRAGERLGVEVVDADLNAFGEVIEEAIVTVLEEGLGDQVEVLLRETSGNSGVFRGELTSAYGRTAERNDRVLQSRGGDLVRFQYVDALRADGDVNVPVEVSFALESGVTGRIAFLTASGSLEVGSFAPGESLQVRVVGADRNRDPAVAERLEIRIEGETNGDKVFLTLLENGEDSGEFSALLATGRARSPNDVVVDDLVLQVSDKERVTALYLDELTGEGEPDVPLTARVVAAGSTPGALLIVDEQGRERGNVRAGETLFLALDDIFLAAIGESESATVHVEGNRTGDRVTVLLRAVGGERGRYLGSVATRFGQTPVQDDVLDVQGGEELRVSYLSPMEGVFHLDVFDTVTVARGSLGRVSIVRADDNLLRTVSPGSLLRFRVDDPDANVRPTALDTVTIRVGVENTPLSRTVTLTETDVNSGLFRGALATALGRSSEGDALPLRGGERIFATYRDALTHTGETNVEITATTRARRVGFAQFTEESVVVDGIPDRWPLESAMASEGNVALVWAQWDRDALYLFVEIADEEVTVKDPTRWYEDADAVEFHLSTDPEGAFRPAHLVGGESPSEFVFWFCPKGAGIYGERPYVGRARPTRQPNFSPPIHVAGREEGSAYRLEIRIPFQRALPRFDPVTSTKLDRLGFNYLVYRSNAPRVWWSPPESPEDPPSAYGVLYLLRSEENVSPPAGKTQRKASSSRLR